MNEILKQRALVASILVICLSLLIASPALAQPGNDDFDSPTPIPSLPFTDTLDTSQATTANDDPDCAGNGHTVWYVFSPAGDMRINANTFGSDYDTTLSVYTGARGSLTQIVCNDDFFDLTSNVTFDALSGETYFFMVGSFFDSHGGNLNFTVQEAAPPLEIDLVVNPTGRVKASTGVVTLSGTVTCSTPAFVSLFGDTRQPAGRAIIRGFFGTFFECDGETPWTASYSGENGRIVGGRLQADVFADASSPFGDFAFDSQSLIVRLHGSR